MFEQRNHKLAEERYHNHHVHTITRPGLVQVQVCQYGKVDWLTPLKLVKAFLAKGTTIQLVIRQRRGEGRTQRFSGYSRLAPHGSQLRAILTLNSSSVIPAS